MLSRKYYRELALQFARLRPGVNESGDVYQMWESMVATTVNAILSNNPSFDRARFMEACGHDPVTWWNDHREYQRRAVAAP